MRNQSIPLLVLSVLLVSSCGSTPKKQETSEQSGLLLGALKEPARDSSVDIQYVLGRDHYRFFAMGKGDLVTANTYMDKQVLDQGSVDRSRYSDFLMKAYGFISNSRNNPDESDQSSCRTPFTVTVRIHEKTHVTHGCRSSDDGSLSKLVKDGEFLLLYSKN